MGLDKKTSLPKSRKEKSTEKGEDLKKDEGKMRQEREYVIPKRNEIKENQSSVSAKFSAQEIKTGLKEVITAVEEMTSKGKPGHDVWEDDQENTLKYGNQQHKFLFLLLRLFHLSLKCDYQNFQKYPLNVTQLWTSGSSVTVGYP